ncbi:MAG: Acetate kinase [Acidobacteriales bacterium]|nr:Acetate kinase [Terriglobales bacterium]
MTTGTILVFNCGSSSIKFASFAPAANEDLKTEISGKLDRIGQSHSTFTVKGPGGETKSELSLPDYESAIQFLLQWLEREGHLRRASAIGHRIVHGGLAFTSPTIVTAEAMVRLRTLKPLAPNHLPSEIAAIEAVAEMCPDIPQVVAFDTAFHHHLPPVARHFALPHELVEKGVLRYGFHGLSFEFVVQELSSRGKLPGRLIIAHLGNGASLAAVKDGQSIDTSMGMTPTGGIPMGTRSGDLDPGVLLFLSQQLGYTVPDLEKLVDKKSGLLGISGLTSNMQDLLRSDDPRASAAVDSFVYSIQKTIGAYAAAMGGVDGLVFTGGIGENSAEIRRRVLQNLTFLGFQLDELGNQANLFEIYSSNSANPIYVVRTNEEFMIARHTLRLVSSSARVSKGDQLESHTH